MPCSKEDCLKNHIVHYDIKHGSTTTPMANIHIHHHKNERRDGGVVMPVAQGLVEPLAMLEKASTMLAPNCPTIFFKPSLKVPYSEEYFSMASTSALSFDNLRCTATNMRHEFSTNWRDFQEAQATSNNQVDMLEGAAATMMGNKPPSWDAAYDDKAASRPMQQVLATYPAFKAWVKSEAAAKKRCLPRNPHASI